LIFEARLYLALSRLAIRLVPFRRLAWFFTRPAARPEVTGEARRQIIRDVRRAVRVAARGQRERIVCFPRGITVQAMLRRRGVSTTLYYGARTRPPLGLEAHVWVQDGERGIVGHRRAAGHKVLARFAAPPFTLAAARDEAATSASSKIG
jgi:hypothetical protein